MREDCPASGKIIGPDQRKNHNGSSHDIVCSECGRKITAQSRWHNGTGRQVAVVPKHKSVEKKPLSIHLPGHKGPDRKQMSPVGTPETATCGNCLRWHEIRREKMNA